jgi:hypothetical protein
MADSQKFGMPVTATELRTAADDTVLHDREYISFLLRCAADQIERASDVVDLDEYCATVLRGNSEPFTGESMSDYQDGPRED